jgi:hypothetical protein
MERNKWVDHVSPISSQQEVTEFVALWELTREVRLDNSREDSIRWRWTADGEYTTKSAYLFSLRAPSVK